MHDPKVVKAKISELVAGSVSTLVAPEMYPSIRSDLICHPELRARWHYWTAVQNENDHVKLGIIMSFALPIVVSFVETFQR